MTQSHFSAQLRADVDCASSDAGAGSAVDIASPAWIMPTPRGLFDVLPEFEPGALDADVFEIEDEAGEVVDQVAWTPDRPARWWLRTGDGLVLGAPEIARSAECDAPIRLLGTPLEYLDAHAHGRPWCAVILRWDAPLAEILSPARSVIPSTPTLEMRLRRGLRNQWTSPPWLTPAPRSSGISA